MITAATIKIPHRTEQGTMVIEHFLVALAAKPKKLGVTILVQTLCGWVGPIKESEFRLHYGSAEGTLSTINCAACVDAFSNAKRGPERSPSETP